MAVVAAVAAVAIEVANRLNSFALAVSVCTSHSTIVPLVPIGVRYSFSSSHVLFSLDQFVFN